ncbi:unnamed protein product [Linum tenue]|uniref:RING-type E3 ubiquitin transferase n=1 Tax=Linum tenue TaxID=586396 RepID=A0AAV0I135_9ROSI|nr:unnamed protein product [Linum tenue]CAI0390652.1 unnamed protein product [Linum tenue]
MGGFLSCLGLADSPAQNANGNHRDRSSESSSSLFMERGNQSGMSSKGENLVAVIYPSKLAATDLDDFLPSGAVDECPICLEEYDSQNPRTDMQCKHYFHLSCVLEWAQRSAACPICNQEFVFEEET